MKNLLLFLFLLPISSLIAQEEVPKDLRLKNVSEINPDKITKNKGNPIKRWNNKIQGFFHDEKPDPTKATLLSLALPGLGQVYNGKDWKVPIIYAGLGTTGYLINRNTGFYRRFKTAYLQRINDEPDEFIDVLNSAEDIKRLRNDAQKTVEQAWFAFGFIYLLNGIDAFVDAHLFTFNVDDDLTVQIAPHFEVIQENKLAGGIGLKMSF